MIKKPAGVTDAELAVLKVLWRRGPLTAKAITEVVYPDGAESEFAAVHSFLQRLERKGLVARDRSAFATYFFADRQPSRCSGPRARDTGRAPGGRLDCAFGHASHRPETAQQKRGC